jgi:phosphoribosylformylglycinamidine synthase
MPKRTVLDPQGQAIQHALSSLGFSDVREVRQGKFFVLDLDGTTRESVERQVERMAREILTNPVIEEFRYEIMD